MSSGAAQAIVRRLEDAGIVTWFDGGWGVDALLGRESRSHADVDLVLDRGDLPRAIVVLREVGFREDTSAFPGRPARVVLARGFEVVDLHPVVFDEWGNGWQELGNSAWGLYPAAGLNGVGQIGGDSVRCLTAELQVRHHLGYPPSDADRTDLRALAVEYGVAIPPEWY